MSQNNIDQGQAAETPTQETRTQETKTFIRQVIALTRRKYAPEDKIRIVLEGFRREVTVSDLCRREGIKPGVFYAWTKDPSASSGDASWNGERASHPEHGERRHPSGDRTPQAENHDGRTTTEEPRSETTCCRPFPGGTLLQKTAIPAFDGATGA